MASGKKSSSSRSRSASSKRVPSDPGGGRGSVTPQRQSVPASGHFAICVRNDEFPASLEVRKLYRVLEDEFAGKHGMIRVIDESGEDYLFPGEYFVRISLPQAVEKQLRKIA